MKRNQKTMLIAAVVFLIALGIYFLFKDDHTAMNKTSSSSTAMEFDNMDLKESKDGKIIWRLKAAHAAVSADKNIVTMNGVEGYFAKDGKEFHISGDKGRIDRKAKTVYMEGNVEGKTGDGDTLNAENLTYDGGKDVLSTDKPFKAVKDGKILTADSFNADRVIEKVTAKGHAKLTDKEDAE